MAVLFTSDTHFGHGGALGRWRRPFPSVAAMNEAMIDRWNATAAPGDEIWHLGDVALGMDAGAIAAILSRLNGTKHLVAGNNDGADTLDQPAWASVGHYVELEVDGSFLVLCHYPFRTWNRMSRGAINLHGHSHGALKPVPRQYDVGVDVWNFAPVPLSRIRAARRRSPTPVAGE